MAKTTVLALVLLSVVCAHAVEIRVTPTPTERKLLRPLGSPLPTRSNRDCSIEGIFPIPGDCTAYIICRKGREYRRQCPANFFFDSVMYCTPDDTADCGLSPLKQALEKELCPRSYGIFPYADDCHKYVVCHEGRARIRTCSEGTVYMRSIGCVDGDECPIPDRSEAKKPEDNNQVLENVGFEEDDMEDILKTLDEMIHTIDTMRQIIDEQNVNRKTSKKSICDLPARTGSCHGYFPRYYYDSKSGACKLFLYGGCRGNDNNFVTLDQCKDTCVREIETEEHEYEEFQCKRSGRFANPNSCDSYIECSVKQDSVDMELVQCPSDQHYNIETKQCDEKCSAQCDQELACTCNWPHCSATCERPNGLFPVLTNCRLYLQCRNSLPKILRCPEGKAFDPEMKECVHIEDTNCATNVNDIWGVFKS